MMIYETLFSVISDMTNYGIIKGIENCGIETVWTLAKYGLGDSLLGASEELSKSELFKN